MMEVDRLSRNMILIKSFLWWRCIGCCEALLVRFHRKQVSSAQDSIPNVITKDWERLKASHKFELFCHAQYIYFQGIHKSAFRVVGIWSRYGPLFVMSRNKPVNHGLETVWFCIKNVWFHSISNFWDGLFLVRFGFMCIGKIFMNIVKVEENHKFEKEF